MRNRLPTIHRTDHGDNLEKKGRLIIRKMTPESIYVNNKKMYMKDLVCIKFIRDFW